VREARKNPQEISHRLYRPIDALFVNAPLLNPTLRVTTAA
jgi:hypothetical protein